MKMSERLQAIYDHGLNDYQIAAKIGAPQTAIHRLRKGIYKSCSYERGTKIVALYREIFGETGGEHAGLSESSATVSHPTPVPAH